MQTLCIRESLVTRLGSPSERGNKLASLWVELEPRTHDWFHSLCAEYVVSLELSLTPRLLPMLKIRERAWKIWSCAPVTYYAWFYACSLSDVHWSTRVPLIMLSTDCVGNNLIIKTMHELASNTNSLFENLSGIQKLGVKTHSQAISGSSFWSLAVRKGGGGRPGRSWMSMWSLTCTVKHSLTLSPQAPSCETKLNVFLLLIPQKWWGPMRWQDQS